LSRKRLDNYLFENDYYESRSRATSAVKAGKVKVDGKVVSKPASKINPDSFIEALQEHPWVSRGGMKLDHAIQIFGVNIEGRICLDVGASTGGFVDVLITRGALKVYAVDVGRDQLHAKLRGDERVISMESTDARKLSSDQFEPLPTLVVCDASFISATKVLAIPLSLVGAGTELVTLVKPQFEVGKDNIARGGLVRDPALAKSALEDVSAWLKTQGWLVLATDTSPIKGGDGNTEFLLHARKK